MDFADLYLDEGGQRDFTLCAEADGQAEKGKGPAIKVSLCSSCNTLKHVLFQHSAGYLTNYGHMQAEKSSPDGTAKKGAKVASAANNNMPAVPKDEPSESTKKSPAGKAAKGNKAATDKKSSTEKASKPKTKAVKEAAAHGKADKAAGAAKKGRKVFDMPGQTRDTPPEVCCKPWPQSHPAN